MRDLNKESQPNSERLYAYSFDYIIRNALIQRVAIWLDQDDRTLEIGAFEGGMTEQLKDSFADLTVLEGSSDLAAGLIQKFGGEIPVINELVESFTPSDKFGNIFLVHTLEHLDDPVEALIKIASWLKPKGRLVVAVPNGEALSRQIAVRMGLIESNDSVTEGEYLQGHRKTYTLSSLLAEIHRAELQVLDFGGVIVKPLSNQQFDRAIESGIVNNDYVDACNDLSKDFPHLCASVYAIIEFN
jgi:SAM-dependent methyltransferase